MTIWKCLVHETMSCTKIKQIFIHELHFCTKPLVSIVNFLLKASILTKIELNINIREAQIETYITCVRECICETEEVHSIQGKQVVQKLLSLIFTSQEGIALVQMSEKSIRKQCEKDTLYCSKIRTDNTSVQICSSFGY